MAIHVDRAYYMPMNPQRRLAGPHAAKDTLTPQQTREPQPHPANSLEGADSENVFLLPDEQVVQYSYVESPPPPATPLSPLLALARLCQVRVPTEIGSNRPVLASIHRPESAGIEELGKFEALFGRDSLISALFVVDQFPLLLETTVCTLARYQGRQYDPMSEEEPGRIPHEVRDPTDPIAMAITQSSGWKWPYYGAVDTTPLFLIAVAKLFDLGRWTAKLERATTAAIDWLIRRLDDGDGLLISQPANPHGIENQVWKDSWDAYSYADGTVAHPPIAPLVAQALAHDACFAGVKILKSTNPADRRRGRLHDLAASLHDVVVGRYWVDAPDGGYCGPALVRSSSGRLDRVLPARSSDMGHLLASNMLAGERDRERRLALIRALWREDMLCSAGIRTLGSAESRYRPTAYHNGTSWPWDTVITALAMDRMGFQALADDLFERVRRVHQTTRLFPEFVRGDSTEGIRINTLVVDVRGRGGRVNRISQPPQEVQAFTVTAMLAMDWRQTSRSRTRVKLPPAEVKMEQALLASATSRGF